MVRQIVPAAAHAIVSIILQRRAMSFVRLALCSSALMGSVGGAQVGEEDEQLLELLSQLEGVAHAGSVGDMLNGQGTIAGSAHAFVCDDSVRPAFTDPKVGGHGQFPPVL